MEGLVIVGVGIVAGIINAVAGAGSIVTFPALIALGYPPVVANASNIAGLIPASVTAALGFRRELAGHWRAVALMALCSLIGGIVGAVLLITLPSAAFSIVVPYLLILAAVLAATQPMVARFVRRRARASRDATMPVTMGLLVGVFATAIYGGYFGAAQGVILLALLGSLWSPELTRANGAKNVLAGVAGVISGVILMVGGFVDWFVVLLIGGGGALGGWIGAHIGRRLPAPVLRAVLVVIAVAAAISLLID